MFVLADDKLKIKSEEELRRLLVQEFFHDNDPAVEVPFLGRSVDMVVAGEKGLTAIELKLKPCDLLRCLRKQARYNMLGAKESWVATVYKKMPEETLSEFRQTGVGLMMLGLDQRALTLYRVVDPANEIFDPQYAARLENAYRWTLSAPSVFLEAEGM